MPLKCKEAAAINRKEVGCRRMPSLRKKKTCVTTNQLNQNTLHSIKNVSSFYSPVKQNQNLHYNRHKNSDNFSGKVSLCGPPAFQAGMTVEAAILMPFFLMLILSLLSFMEIIRLQNSITMGLREAGTPMTVYGYAGDRLRESTQIDLTGIMPNVILTYGYVSDKVNAFVGEDYLDHSPLSGEAGAIQYITSSIMERDDQVDLRAVYFAEPDFNVAFLPKLALVSRYFGRAWTGYQVDGKAQAGNQETFVYVTPNGTVYHMSRECTHLRLSIKSCPLEEVNQRRNGNGGRYNPCTLCGKKEIVKMVYITTEGDRYHTSVQCSGLKRTIDVIPLSQAGGRTKCKRCGGKE